MTKKYKTNVTVPQWKNKQPFKKEFGFEYLLVNCPKNIAYQGGKCAYQRSDAGLTIRQTKFSSKTEGWGKEM